MNGTATCVALGSIVSFAASAADDPQREMNVQQGPETVFERPIGEVFPLLEGATATDANGRVGNELVFWGYTLQNGGVVNLFACALRDDVDCEARSRLICPGASRLLERTQATGRVRTISCRAVAVETPGGERPGCDDREVAQPLDTGVMQCE
jgi:hypothetical protein